MYTYIAYTTVAAHKSPFPCFSCADEDDYTSLSGEIVRFPADSDLPLNTTTCQTVSITGDDIREKNETFTVMVTPEHDFDKVIGIQNLTITIQDDGDGNLFACESPH